MDLRNLRSIAEKLETLLFPLAEISIFKKPSQREILCLNRFSDSPPVFQENGIEKLMDGSILKRVQIPIFDETGDEVALFQVRLDISTFFSFHKQLEKIIQPHSKNIFSCQDHIESSIDQYLQTQKTDIKGMSRKQKQELIYFLFEQGIFRYKDAARFLGAKLNLSRATIYNYLSWSSQIEKLHVHRVDISSEKSFSINPIGVIQSDSLLTSSVMKKITKELGFPEAVFMMPSSKGHVYFRYFTLSGQEIKYSGHGTLSALSILAKKRNPLEKHKLEIETLTGILPVEVNINENEQIQAILDLPPILLEFSLFSAKEISRITGIPLSALDTEKPIMFDKIHQSLFIPLISLNSIKEISLEIPQCKKFCKEKGIHSLCFLTSQVFDINHHAHIRCFAPKLEIEEDPFAGLAIGAASLYLFKNKIISPNFSEITIEQGHFLGKPSSTKVLVQNINKIKLKLCLDNFFSSNFQLKI